MAVLTASLARLRADFNTVAPERDKTSDGWIGDAPHQEGTSGHNPESSGKSEYTDGDDLDEVRAIDVDKDLRVPNLTMLKIIQRILVTPNDLKRLRYIIFNRVIWSKSVGWRPRAYSGSNPHDQHGHFSGDPLHDSDTAAWSVLSWKVEPVADSPLVVDTGWRVDAALMRGLDNTIGGPSQGQQVWIVGKLNEISGRIEEVDDRVESLAIGGVDPQIVAAAIHAAVAQALPAALEAVLDRLNLTVTVEDPS